MSFSLKTLYSLDDNSFNNLRAQLNQERLEIYSKGDIDSYLLDFKNNIESMIRKQSLIKNKIPFDKLNMVNNFLIDLTTDDNNFKSRIKSNNSSSNNSNNSSSNNSSSSHNSNLSDCQSLVRIDSSSEDVLRPSTISCILTITLEQSFTGCQCPIEIDRCIHENEYMVREKEKIYVDIASGIDNGEIIILKNRGNETVKGLVGDVKVHIQVRDHDFFIREGLNLRYKKMISFEESICGFTFNLEYLNGNTICIRNGSGDVILNGSIKTIKNRGMVRNNRTGDLIIEFIIKQPGRIPSDTIQKLKNILF